MKQLDTWLLCAGSGILLVLMLQSASCDVVSASRAAADLPSSNALVLAQICVHEASLPVRDTTDYDFDGDTTDWIRHPWRGPDVRDLNGNGDTEETLWQSVDWGYDCWAIHEVLLRGAARHHIRYRSYAQAYARGVFHPRSRAGNHWAGGLTPAGAEPPSWPRVVTRQRNGVVEVLPHLPWRSVRPNWFHAWEVVQEISRAGLDSVDEWSVCERPVHHWGSPTLDHHRAVRAGWDTVHCGPATGELTANRFYFAQELAGREAEEEPGS